MKKASIGMIVLAVAVVSFCSGYFLANSSTKFLQVKHQAAIGIEKKPNIQSKIFDQSSKIVCEKEYRRCNHVIISEFEQKNELIGKSLEEIQAMFTIANGFRIAMQDDTLLIHQVIDDWCPEDKAKCRFKEYQGRVAVYQGPDAKNDTLLRVTSIFMSALPQEIQNSIRSGQYEFKNEELLNDALENFDEYL